MTEQFIDLTRALHLIFLALGMGTGMYLEIRTLTRVSIPLSLNDLIEFDRAHKVVLTAVVGLWISGITLVYVRTGFDMASFSPKLWVKLGVVLFLTINALLIGRYVLPILESFRGKSIKDLPLRKKSLLAIVASNSAFCWIAALALGSSAVLKGFDWGMLWPLFSLTFLAMTVMSLAITLKMR